MSNLMNLPNYGFGPMTDQSRRGRMPEEARSYAPSWADRMSAALRMFAPQNEADRQPLRQFVGRDIPQAMWNEFDAAAKGLERGVTQGDLPALASSGARTLMLAGMPLASAGVAGGSLGGFALADALGVAPAAAAAPNDAPAPVRKPDLSKEEMMRQEARQDALKRAEIEAIARANAEAGASTKLAEGNRQRVDDAKQRLAQALKGVREPPVDNTMVGRFRREMGDLAPFAAGALGGAAARFASPYIGAGKFIGDGASARQKIGAKVFDDYAMPGIAGAELGRAVALGPMQATANRADATNPEMQAWKQYLLDLPADADKERAVAEASMQHVPPIDPSVSYARDQLGSLGTQVGATLQGIAGGMFGSYLPPALRGFGKTAAEVPAAVADMAGGIAPAAVAGHHRGMARAANASQARAEAEVLAAEVRAASDEALRRSGAQRAGPSEAMPDPPAPPTSPPPPAEASPNPPAFPTSIELTPSQEMRDMMANALQSAQARGGRKLPPPGRTGPWVGMWSEPARDAIASHIAAGGSMAPSVGFTAPNLLSGIAERMPAGAKLPSRSEAQTRLARLRQQLGNNPTQAEYEAWRARTPVDANVLGIGGALGIGAAAAGSDPFLQALINAQQQY